MFGTNLKTKGMFVQFPGKKHINFNNKTLIHYVSRHFSIFLLFSQGIKEQMIPVKFKFYILYSTQFSRFVDLRT